MAPRIDPTPRAVIGLDLGGTLIKSAVVGRDGSVAEVQRRPTRSDRGPEAVLATIIDVAEEQVAHARASGIDVRAVGLASCGLVNETSGTAIFSAALQWRDVPLRATIADRVGLPVAVGHDVRSGALAEARIGAGRGHDIVFFVPIGTGVGGALVIAGRTYAGAHSTGVELGHMVIRPGGIQCPCGQSGCLDTLAGGAAIGRRYAEMATVSEGGPAYVEAVDVIRLARHGEPVAVRVWTEAVDAIAEALAVAVTLLDPSVIVIGGGVGQSGDALHVPLRAALASRLSFQTLPEIVAAALGDDAGCIGAGLLAWDLVGTTGEATDETFRTDQSSAGRLRAATRAVGVPAALAEAVLAAREGGRPVCAYLYDLASLASHARMLRHGLGDNCRLFYAVKANSSTRIIEALWPVLDGFDIASTGEMAKVQAVAPSARLAFGGPGKSDADLEHGLRNGVDLIAVESILELSRIDHIASGLGTMARVLLRVNPPSVAIEGDLRMAGAATQFGIEKAQLGAAIDHARSLASVVVGGLHFHSVSNNLVASRHLEFVAQCLELADREAAHHRVALSIVNIGGGFGIDYSGRLQFDWGHFVDGLRQIAARYPGTELIIEAGRLVVAECGYYAAEVLDLKRNHGTRFAIVRGGRHHFRISEAIAREHPYSIVEVPEWPYPFQRPEVRDEPITIAGELGTPTDLLIKDAWVRRLRVGDVVVFPLAGAYRWDVSYHDFLSQPYPEVLYLC